MTSFLVASQVEFRFRAGDYQFDIYRIMKHYTKGDWEAFSPLTNVLVRRFR